MTTVIYQGTCLSRSKDKRALIVAQRTRTDYACSGSEDEVTRGCLAKGYFQDWTRVVEVDP